MADIVRLEDRRRREVADGPGKIQKWIDGQLVEYIDFDALPLAEQHRILTANSAATTNK